jgi:hypothetical protein
MNRSVRLIIKLLLGIVAISAVAAPAGSGGKQRGNPEESGVASSFII